VVAGSRCAVVLADLPDAIPVLLAVWARNAVAVLVDPLWGEETRQTVLRHSGAEYLLTIGSQACVSDLRGSTLYRPDRPELPASTAVLAYTSGSTGAPKGIALPHDRVISGMLGAAAVLDHYRERPSTCFGSSIRLSGFGVLALHFLWSAVRGSSVVVLPRLDLTSAGRYWRDLDEHRIDLAVLVAPLVELLLRSSRIRPGAVPPLFINSSGPLSERAHTRFHDQFGAWILNCYGLTECCFAITMGDTSLPGLTTLSVGRPYQVRVRLRAADGAVVTGPGEGEVEFWGPLMSDGYYDDPTGDRRRDERALDAVRRSRAPRREWPVLDRGAAQARRDEGWPDGLPQRGRGGVPRCAGSGRGDRSAHRHRRRRRGHRPARQVSR
jgi:acyl-coenzyme A synthetase/AMP-(fatty) acid ligase